ncbi:MAG TPA: beta-xylosidase [Opitutaceae bacterium]
MTPHRLLRRLLAAFGLIAACATAARGETPSPAAPPFAVTIDIDAAQRLGPLRPIWRFFGADEPNYATMKDGQKLLGELGRLSPGNVYFRAHNLLTSGDGTPALKWGSTNAYTEDAQGNPVYDWRILDLIFKSYLDRGVRPLVQLGFMPKDLASEPGLYRHEWRPGLPYQQIMSGWHTPPKDYAKWGELAYQWAKHCVDTYGAAEVEKWYWEVWNEPNGHYWSGTPEDFRKLHDYAIAGVRRALPTARVGGPHTAGHGGQFMKDFLEHCLRGTNHATGERGTPLDFVAFHAKGSPTFVDGHVRMGIANHLRTIDTGFATIASYPELNDTPVILGESDPEGCAACQGPANSYRNGTMYSSYTAASFARKHDLAARHGVNFEGAVTWAFEFEDQPYFAGFRQLASNGVPLAVLNVFRMFARMEGDRLAARSSGQVPLETIVRDGVRGAPDVGVLSSRTEQQVAALVWHYHDDDVAGPDAIVTLKLAGLPPGATPRVTHFRVDPGHSNPYGAWLKMGSPIAPDEKQYAALLAASELAQIEAPALTRATAAGGESTLSFALPRQGVSLLLLNWE